jgi:hypothetical protein
MVYSKFVFMASVHSLKKSWGAFGIFFLLGLSSVLAQVYPVHGTGVLIPPHSVYLSDYTSRATDRLALTLSLNDLSRPELRVRLRLRIEGQNVRIETKPEYIGSEIILQGGVPLRLNGSDLIEYFNPAHLNFSGITRREFERTGALPEGFYQFCFEVLEYNRGVKISHTICAPGWFILNDPPLINLPRMGEKIQPLMPQNVLFQWTPRHTGSPNAAFATEYELKLVEIWPAGRNPNDAILTSPPILETTTRSTSYIYGPAETPLEPGRHYALRIQAKSMVGAEEYNLFKNQGYSEVVSFVYGDACEAPQNVTPEPGTTRFRLQWDGRYNHSAYRLRYRQQGTTQWYSEVLQINEAQVNGLRPSTTYEYTLAGACGGFDGQETPLATLTTLGLPLAEYACGLPLETFDLDPSNLLSSLAVGDIVRAGDFDVTLTQVSGTGGRFSGKGVIEMSFFNKARAGAEFTDIAVNTDYRLVDGHLNLTGAGVEVVPEGVMNFLDNLDGALDWFDKALGQVEAYLPKPIDPHGFVADTLIQVQGNILSVVKLPNGNVMVMTDQGQTIEVPAGGSTALTDAGGKAYVINEVGDFKKTTPEVAERAANREYHLVVTFENSPQARYGFDKKQYPAQTTGYHTLQDKYDIPWKSVASRGSDPIHAVLGTTDIDPARITFEMEGQPVPGTFINRQAVVNVPGKDNGSMVELLALYAPADTLKEQVLGKVKVVSYDIIRKELHLVGVNGASSPLSPEALQAALNSIYQQGVVEWTVSADSLSISLGETFDTGGSGLLSNYTADMRQVISAYKAHMEDDAYYLFLIDNPSGGANQLGYMPRGKQAGFLYVSNLDADKMALTTAHELGHGAFNLPHTFSDERYPLPEASSDNLMDYANGSRLYKNQWDKMRYPAIVIGLFEEDEEGEYEETDPILAYILKKAQELNLHNPKVLAIKHCKACNENNSLTQVEPIYNNNVVFGEINGMGYLFNAPGFKCFAILFNESNENIHVKTESGIGADEILEGLTIIMKDFTELDCSPYLENLNSYLECNTSETNDISTTYIDQLYKQVSFCLNEPKPSVFDEVKEEILLVLNNDFYSNVKTCVKLFDDKKEEILNTKNQTTGDCEIFIDIKLIYNIEGEPIGVETKLRLSESYLANYTERWDIEVSLRGIDTSAEELRQQVIQDFESIETNQSFVNRFINGFSGLFKKGVANFTEGIIASQKIAINVWEHGEINRSTWHTSDIEYSQWPTFARFHPAFGGGTDGLIDEVLGIPMAIKGVYGIMTDEEQKQALLGLFSREGFNQLWQSVKSEASEIANDADRAQHFGSKTTVQAATMLVPGLQITKVGAVTTVIGKVSNGFQAIANPKVINLLEGLKKAEKYKPDILKAIEDFLKRMDPHVLDKLAEIPGFDKVISDMAQHWNKFHGGKHVLEYFSKKVDNISGKISFEIKQAINFNGETVARVYDAIVESAEGVVRYEMKNWSGWFPNTIKTQFVRDLQAINTLDELKWVFNSTQGVNKGNLKTKFLETLKKVDGSPISELENIPMNKVKQLFGEAVENIDEFNKAEKIIEALSENRVFNQIFEIVD